MVAGFAPSIDLAKSLLLKTKICFGFSEWVAGCICKNVLDVFNFLLNARPQHVLQNEMYRVLYLTDM